MMFGFDTVIVQERASAGPCDPDWIACGDPNTPARPYPRPPHPATAGWDCFIRSLLRVHSHRYRIKQPRTIVRGLVTRIGFKPMTPNLEGLCSIQLSYRAGNGRKNKKKSLRGQTHLRSAVLAIFGLPPSSQRRRLNKKRYPWM